MKLSTRDFGVVEVEESEIVTFTGPIFGFESYRRFVFLYQEDVSEHFIWLQSVENPDLCFILVQPSLVMEPYHETNADQIVEAGSAFTAFHSAAGQYTGLCCQYPETGTCLCTGR